MFTYYVYYNIGGIQYSVIDNARWLIEWEKKNKVNFY